MLSRSTLAFSAFALLAAGGVMGGAAAGPDDMNKRGDRGRDNDGVNLSINLDGPRGHGDWRHRPPVIHPTPAFVEVVPHSLDVQAYQTGDTVMVLVRGENTTSGFATSLERIVDGRFDGVVNLVLRNTGPAFTPRTFRAEVCVPFAVSGGFRTDERVNEVRLLIAGTERCIPVQRIDQMRRAN